MSKNVIYQSMINTTRWRELRRWKLSQCPLCERCAEEGRTTAATEVHHISPVEDVSGRREMERRMFDPHNLRALCHDCHVRTHTEMGRGGKAYAARKRESERLRFERLFLAPDGTSTGAEGGQGRTMAVKRERDPRG